MSSVRSLSIICRSHLSDVPVHQIFLRDEKSRGVNVPATYFNREITTGHNKNAGGHPESIMGDWKNIRYILDVQKLPPDIRMAMFMEKYGYKYKKMNDNSYPDLSKNIAAVSTSLFGEIEYMEPNTDKSSTTSGIYAIKDDGTVITPETWKLEPNYMNQAAQFHYYPRTGKINILVSHPGWKHLGLFTDARTIMIKDIKDSGNNVAWGICNVDYDAMKLPGARFYRGNNPISRIKYCENYYKNDDKILAMLPFIYDNSVPETVDPTGSYANSCGYRIPI